MSPLLEIKPSPHDDGDKKPIADWGLHTHIPYFSGRGSDGVFPIIPEDVPMGLIAIYGFSPPIRTGRDHRLGFGFRFGNHADLQVMYELGPQIRTKPLQPVKVRSASASYRARVTRRRPVVELLLRAGLLREAEYDYNYNVELGVDEPR